MSATGRGAAHAPTRPELPAAASAAMASKGIGLEGPPPADTDRQLVSTDCFGSSCRARVQVRLCCGEFLDSGLGVQTCMGLPGIIVHRELVSMWHEMGHFEGLLLGEFGMVRETTTSRLVSIVFIIA